MTPLLLQLAHVDTVSFYLGVITGILIGTAAWIVATGAAILLF